VNYLQAVPVAPWLVIRTSQEPAGIAAAIRSAAREVDKSLLIFNVRTMDDLRSASVSPRIFLMALILGFGGLTLALAAVGLYGVLSLVVAERTREIGIRLAIGALERQVLSQFLVESIVLALFGGIIGIMIGLALAGAASILMDVPFAADIRVIALAFVVSAAIGVVFGYFPARRAARLDPIEALRHE
jgi:putative ABC transport system permease protein